MQVMNVLKYYPQMGSVRCGLCGKSVPYKPVDVADLGEHLYQSHPNKEVAYFTFDDENDKDDNKRKEKMYKTTGWSSFNYKN